MALGYLMAQSKPRTIAELAQVASARTEVAGRAMSHLVEHGWFSEAEDGWTPELGRRCDCVKPPRGRQLGLVPQGDVQLWPIGEQVALYRLFNIADVLLYVGITDDLLVRMRTHEAERPWWPEVARKTVGWLANRADADLAETLTIAAEKPRYNSAKVYAPVIGVEF